MASSLPIPSSISLSMDALNSFNWLAMAALIAIMAAAQLDEEPAARNSKRLPVKANGEVRLRSVVSRRISGIRPIPNLRTIINTFTRKVRKSMFPFGFLPGAKRLIPVSVQSDQLLCFPEPLTPL